MLLDTVSLPNCSPPRALSPPLACASGTALGALCVAVSTILERRANGAEAAAAVRDEPTME